MRKIQTKMQTNNNSEILDRINFLEDEFVELKYMLEQQSLLLYSLVNLLVDKNIISREDLNDEIVKSYKKISEIKKISDIFKKYDNSDFGNA